MSYQKTHFTGNNNKKYKITDKGLGSLLNILKPTTTEVTDLKMLDLSENQLTIISSAKI